jgi:hypothetical protein
MVQFLPLWLRPNAMTLVHPDDSADATAAF